MRRRQVTDICGCFCQDFECSSMSTAVAERLYKCTDGHHDAYVHITPSNKLFYLLAQYPIIILIDIIPHHPAISWRAAPRRLQI